MRSAGSAKGRYNGQTEITYSKNLHNLIEITSSEMSTKVGDAIATELPHPIYICLMKTSISIVVLLRLRQDHGIKR